MHICAERDVSGLHVSSEYLGLNMIEMYDHILDFMLSMHSDCSCCSDVPVSVEALGKKFESKELINGVCNISSGCSWQQRQLTYNYCDGSVHPLN